MGKSLFPSGWIDPLLEEGLGPPHKLQNTGKLPRLTLRCFRIRRGCVCERDVAADRAVA